MKKHTKKAAIIVLSLMLCLCVCVQANAAAVYVVNGYAYNILNNTSIAICGWEGESTDLVIPNALVNRTVVSVASRALKDNTALTSVDFSNAHYLNTIEMEAFDGCTSLTRVDLPRTVTAMGESVFQNCTSLQAVDIHARVTSVPEMCFYNCSSLSAVSLSPTITEIRKFAFGNCTALEYVEIPRTVTTIASSAFRNTNVTIGCYYGSAAYEFAVQQNVSYTLLDGVLLGDANGDGHVDITDATAIQRSAAALETPEGIYLYASDTNRDGQYDVTDATVLQEFIAGIEIPYPVGEIMTQ